MKVAIVGSRNFNDYDKMCEVLFEEIGPSQDEIISGGANGADKLAEQFAKEHDFKFTEFPANWKGYGKNAGRIRNAEMVAQADRVISFWDGVSTGSKHMIESSREHGLQVLVIDYP